MKFAQVYLNGLTNKLDLISALMSFHNINVLGVSESWLHPVNLDSCVSIPGYEIARSDSPRGSRKHGIAAYNRKACKYNVIACSVSNILVILLCTYVVYLIFIYRPPSYDLVQNNSLISFISEFCTNREVVVLEDFNLATLERNAEDMFLNYFSQNDMSFFNTFASVGLTKIIRGGTFFPSGNALDLCLVLDLDRIGLTRVFPPIPGSYYYPFPLEYVFQTQCAITNNYG